MQGACLQAQTHIMYTLRCMYIGRLMTTARVFQNGNSQAVRIPKEFQLAVKEVEIFRRGDELVLRPIAQNLSDVLDIFAAMPDDFMAEGRLDPPPQERDFD